jgi:hypothetical protein
MARHGSTCERLQAFKTGFDYSILFVLFRLHWYGRVTDSEAVTHAPAF